MRSKICENCGNANFVPDLVEIIENGKMRLVEVCRDCEEMIGENPFDEEQTLSWYHSHSERYKKFLQTHTWNGWKKWKGKN